MASAEGAGVSAAASDGSDDILILHSCAPASTFSPSGTRSSVMIPVTGEGTGIAV